MPQRQYTRRATPTVVAECLAQQSLERTMHGGDMADAAPLLASGAAMVTGQLPLVDGGRVVP